jgi:hypothetical protein
MGIPQLQSLAIHLSNEQERMFEELLHITYPVLNTACLSKVYILHLRWVEGRNPLVLTICSCISRLLVNVLYNAALYSTFTGVNGAFILDFYSNEGQCQARCRGLLRFRLQVRVMKETPQGVTMGHRRRSARDWAALV